MIEFNGVETLYYGYTDNQGSLVALTDENGTVVEHYAYDPWGARRNPDNWAEKDTRTSWLVNRGYTGHEHLDAFGIINMNGRVYDPLTAQFFSPDPFIQALDNWNNFNRYAHCMNNPVMYTDPSGYNYLKFGCSQEELDRIKSFKGSASMLGDNLETRSTFSHWGVTHNFSNSYYYAGNGKYKNMYGHNVSYDEVKNNFIEPNLTSPTDEQIITALNTVQSEYKFYSVQFASGKISYVFSIGDLGNATVSSNGGLNFGNATLTYLSMWKGGTGGEIGSGNRGYIISYLNGTAAYGIGATADMGIVIDASGNKKSYFSIGVTAGLGASAGQGLIVTNKNFHVNDYSGESVNVNFTIPILSFLSVDFFGDSNKLGLTNKGDYFPGENTRGAGLNYGVGAGGFLNWTYTFIFEAPKINYFYLSSLSHGR